jgi:hypothetical protein
LEPWIDLLHHDAGASELAERASDFRACFLDHCRIIEPAEDPYLDEILAPSLTAGQIVVTDNLAAHKTAKIEQLIQACKCQLLFLPASSPDFSPIEESFSKRKNAWRRAGARTREALQEVICQTLLTVTAQDAHGWFRHCGYVPREG